MKSRAATIFRKHRLPRLIAETLEGRRLFSVSSTLNVSLNALVTLQPAALHADRLAAAPDGALWYASGGAVERVAPGGQTTAFTPADMGANLNQPWVVNSNIVFTSDNSAWLVVSNGQTDELAELATTGTFTGVATLIGAPSHYLAVSHDDVWFTQGQNMIGARSADGPLPVFRVPGATALTGLATDASDNVWFGASSSAGGLLGSINASGASQVQTLSVQPHNLTAAPDGSLYFTGPHAIWQKNPLGGLSSISVGALSPDALAPAANGSIWFIDQSPATRPLWRLNPDMTLQQTPISGAPLLTSLAIGADGTLHFTASSAQSADLGQVQVAGNLNLFNGGILTSANISVMNDDGITVGALGFSGGISLINVSIGGLNISSNASVVSNGGGALTESNTTAMGTATVFQGDGSHTATIILDVAPATRPSAPAPTDPALPRRPADAPAPVIPDDPGSFDGEFTIQPSRPLPPEAPRPAAPSGDSYQSRGNGAAPVFLVAAPPPVTSLARPIHTHASSHRDPRVTAALFSSSAALLATTFPDGPTPPPAGAASHAPAISKDAAAFTVASGASSNAGLVLAPVPDTAAITGDPISQWWKWTSYVAVAPSLFDRRRARITRIHW